MSTKKVIPDKSNFLEKFAAVENYLQEDVQPPNRQVTREKNYIDHSDVIENEPGKNEFVEAATPQKLMPEALSPQLKCANCGAERNPQHAFCFSCGQRYEPVPVTQTDQPQPPTNTVEETILKCAECGTPHEKDDVFCMNCGKKL